MVGEEKSIVHCERMFRSCHELDKEPSPHCHCEFGFVHYGDNYRTPLCISTQMPQSDRRGYSESRHTVPFHNYTQYTGDISLLEANQKILPSFSPCCLLADK
jgi:hypothetical protein